MTECRLILLLCLLSIAPEILAAESVFEREARLRRELDALEQLQAQSHDQMDAVAKQRGALIKKLRVGPDDELRRLTAESSRLEQAMSVKQAAVKPADPDEAAALKIEYGALRRARDEADQAATARWKTLAATTPAGAAVVDQIKVLEAELARLEREWNGRRGEVSERHRDLRPVSPEPRNARVIELELPPAPDAAERRQRFAERNSPANVAALARSFFRVIDPRAKGVERAVALFEQGRPTEALEAYREYFFAKVTEPEKYGLTPAAFMDDENQFMCVRHPPATWIAEALQGIAHTTSHDLGDEYVMRVKVGPPGAVHWAYVADQPVNKNGKLVWLEFQRRFGRGISNDGGYDGLREPLLDAYLLNGDAAYLRRWAEYSDDWALNWQSDVAASPHNIRWADAIISRLVCGFVSRMRAIALARPAMAREMPAPTLARMLLRLQEEYLAPNILVARTTRQNWNMMGLGFNARNALLLPEFKPAQWAGRETRRCVEKTYVFTIMLDGGCVEYGDEGHQGVWRERIGGALQLWKQQPPAWFTPAWEGELLDTFNQNARFWVRHLKADGYQHRAGMRYARELFVGNIETKFGPHSLDAQAPWVTGEPEVKRVLSTVFGSGEHGAPRHQSDVMPVLGEFMLRGSWDKDAPLFYMHAGRTPNSGAIEDATAFRAHAFGRNLLIGSAVFVDGRSQNAHFKLVDNVGSKTDYLTYADDQPGIGRWHTSGNFDVAEGFYEGVYENRAGRKYLSPFDVAGEVPLRGIGEPPVTDVRRHTRQVFFSRQPAFWVVVDRLETEGRHRYEQPYEIFTPVTKLDWLRRARTPIPNAETRVVLDETNRVIRTHNPGWPNLSLHHFASSPIRYSFDAKSHDLAHKTKGEIAAAEDQWRLNRPELRDVLAFTRRVVVGWEGAGPQTLVTLTVPRATDESGAVREVKPATDGGFTATAADGTKIEFRAAGVLTVGGQKVDIAEIPPPIRPVAFAPAVNVFTEHVDVTMRCATPGVEIRYTLDGSDPTPQSALYRGPVRLTQTARVKAIALRPGVKEIPWELAPGQVTIPTWAVFTKESLRPAVPPANGKPGLLWEYMEGGQFALVSHSEWLPPAQTGTTTNLFDVSMRATGGAFGVRYRGHLNVPADGVYTFHAPREIVYPDSEAGYDLRVFIGEREWEPATRRHALGTWSVALQKGAHPFQVIFVDTRAKPYKYETWRDWPNPAVLWPGTVPALEITGPGLDRQPLPAHWLVCDHPATKSALIDVNGDGRLDVIGGGYRLTEPD